MFHIFINLQSVLYFSDSSMQSFHRSRWYSSSMLTVLRPSIKLSRILGGKRSEHFLRSSLLFNSFSFCACLNFSARKIGPKALRTEYDVIFSIQVLPTFQNVSCIASTATVDHFFIFKNIKFKFYIVTLIRDRARYI